MEIVRNLIGPVAVGPLEMDLLLERAVEIGAASTPLATRVSPARCGASATREAVAMTGALPVLMTNTAATSPPSPMFRMRPVTTSWRGHPRIRDSQRSMTPIAPELVHSIATSAMYAIGPTTRRLMAHLDGVDHA